MTAIASTISLIVLITIIKTSFDAVAKQEMMFCLYVLLGNSSADAYSNLNLLSERSDHVYESYKPDANKPNSPNQLARQHTKRNQNTYQASTPTRSRRKPAASQIYENLQMQSFTVTARDISQRHGDKKDIDNQFKVS